MQSNPITAKTQSPVKAPSTATGVAKQSVSVLMNSMLDSEGYRKRFNDLLGKRSAQFVSSMVTMVTASPQLQKAFQDSPLTIIQSALKAAAFNLPIDPALGQAYIVPFNDYKSGKTNAQFIMGYKGLIQLAIRTGAYSKLNVTDVRQGELISFDRLTEDIEISFVQDETEREKLPIIGYCCFFRLTNGFEKCVYMSLDQIEAHEKRHRKGRDRSPIWNTDFDAMAKKTVLRLTLSKWGLLSIDYQTADEQTVQAAQDIASGAIDDESEDTVTVTPEKVTTEEAK